MSVEGTIEVAGATYAVEAAELSWTATPSGMLAISLEVRGADGGPWDAPVCRLVGIDVPGATLLDLSGQVTTLARGERPDPIQPRFVNLVAGMYIGDHVEVVDSVIRWGVLQDGRLALNWEGRVPHPDDYSDPSRYPLRVEVVAPVVERPFELVWAGLIYADESAPHGLVSAVARDVAQALAADLASRGWFVGRPFVGLDLIVRITPRRGDFDPPPSRCRAHTYSVIVDVARKEVRRGRDALHAALTAAAAAAVEALEARYPQRIAPRWLT